MYATEFVECGKDVILLSEVFKYQPGIFPISEILVLLIPCKQGY